MLGFFGLELTDQTGHPAGRLMVADGVENLLANKPNTRLRTEQGVIF